MYPEDLIAPMREELSQVGFEATRTAEDVEQNNILISRITPNPNQPRKVFDEKALKQLAQSIDEKGLISPITVKASNNK